MVKSTSKKAKGTVSTKKKKKTARGRKKMAEYIDCLAELNKLQAELLAQMQKELE